MNSTADFPALDSGMWDRIELRVRAFEAAWQAGHPPLIGDFLTDEERGCAPLLAELIHADLEFRLARTEPVRVEQYLDAHPVLRDNPSVVTGLLLTEYRCRLVREPNLSIEDVARRFPTLLPELLRRAGEVTLGPPALRPDSTNGTARIAPPTIPGYQIEAELGRGGMGIVYRARDEHLGRVVAIKTILNGSQASGTEQDRFRREAESAAKLQHPQVLPVYHIGVHNGLWYVVLEYAAGGSLAQSLTGNPLDPRRSASMVEGLARAVAAAHECGIIHSDLKPSNILIAVDGTLKVADFGLARQLHCDAADTTASGIAGTPGYMAPEQTLGSRGRLGPAADIHGLGVILYELLTGQRPYRGATALETLEQVRLAEPVAPRRLVPAVPPDLNTICLKCLEKRPEQRYRTALELADELCRFQRGVPIQARPAGAAGRLWRWTKRNRHTASILAAMAVLIMATAIGSLGFAVMMTVTRNTERQLRLAAEKARDEARTAREAASAASRRAQANEQKAATEAQVAARTSEFLVQLFRSADFSGFSGQGFQAANPQSMRNLTAAQLISLGGERLQKELHDQPLVRARLLTTIGTTALNLGMLRNAESHFNEAIAICQDQTGLSRADCAEALVGSGRLLALRGNYAEAQSVLQEALELQTRAFGPQDLRVCATETILGGLALEWSQPDLLKQAGDWLRHALQQRAQQLGAKHIETQLTLMLYILWEHEVTRDHKTAVEKLQTLLSEIDGEMGQSVLKTLLMHQAATRLHRQDNYAGAATQMAAAVDQVHSTFGAMDHPLLVRLLIDASWISRSNGNFVAAAQQLKDAADMGSRLIGEDKRLLRLQLELVERFYVWQGQLPEAESLLDNIVDGDLLQLLAGDEQFWALRIHAMLKFLRGDLSAAEQSMERALAVKNSLSEPSLWGMEFLHLQRAQLAFCCGRFDMGRQQLQELRDTAAPDRPHGWVSLLPLYVTDGDSAALAEVRRQFRDSVKQSAELPPRLHPDHLTDNCHVARAMGDDPELEPILRDWHDNGPDPKYPQHQQIFKAAVRSALGRLLLRRGELDEAEILVRQAVQVQETSLGTGHVDTVESEFLLARILLAQGQVQEAERLAREALTRRTAATGNDHPWTWTAWRELARFLRDAGHTEEAGALAMQSLRHTRERLGVCHPDYMDSAAEVALSLMASQQHAAAELLLEQVLAEVSAHIPERSPPRAWITGLLALSRLSTVTASDAAARQTVVGTLRSVWGEHDARTWYLLRQLQLSDR